MTVIRDTYKIECYESSQFLEAYQDDVKRALEAAIDYIREERTRLYCIPARWEAYLNQDGSITVHRFRNKTTKTPPREESHPCPQCGTELGPERFLGPVCGACCRYNHRKVVGHA